MGKINKSKLILVVLLSAILSGCEYIYVLKEHRIDPEFCYEGSNFGLDRLINTGGYYLLEIPYDRTINTESPYIIQDTIRNALFFLDDGSFYTHGTWGRYIIENNIIKVQYRHHVGAMTPAKTEIWFDAIESDTIIRIASRFMGNIITEDEFRNSQFHRINTDRYTAFFVPSDTLPNPDDNWLKNHKWFWCSEDDYKAWKRNRR